MPLKFGTETLTSVTCARACVTLNDQQGRSAVGWGETPLSVQWFWPSSTSYETRHDALKRFCRSLANELRSFKVSGHALEIGHAFQEQVLPELTRRFSQELSTGPLPYLAALGTLSVFDQALHDAYGNLVQRDTYSTYTDEFMSADLAHFLEPASGSQVRFAGLHPSDYLEQRAPNKLRAWHLVGGLDPLSADELTGNEPCDDYPVLLRDWIRSDGLKCLKVKLRGDDAKWDYQRLIDVGAIAIEENLEWLTADFNCTVTEPTYVNEILDRCRDEYPRGARHVTLC